MNNNDNKINIDYKEKFDRAVFNIDNLVLFQMQYKDQEMIDSWKSLGFTEEYNPRNGTYDVYHYLSKMTHIKICLTFKQINEFENVINTIEVHINNALIYTSTDIYDFDIGKVLNNFFNSRLIFVKRE